MPGSDGNPRPVLIDTHAHLTASALSRDLADVLQRAETAGVAQILTVGTTAEDSLHAVELARGAAALSASVSIHPNDLADAAPGDWDRVVALAGDPVVVAIGETGLDRHWDRTPFAMQKEGFDRHLDLAAGRGLPVIIHCRDAYPDLVAHLRARGGPVRGVVHAFAGTAEEAEALLDLGLHISFAGVITFTNRALDALRAIAASVPDDRLLIETDCPYLTPHPHRGKRNEPAFVALTAERLAELRGLTCAALGTLTTANARRLFGLSIPA